MSHAKNGSLPVCSTYDALCEQFSWSIPDMFNIADAICDRWAADEQRVAITFEDADRQVRQVTYRSLQQHANRLANLFASLGIVRGDRITVCLPQRPECAIAHIACFKSGIVSCLASVLFGEEALKHRINGSRSRLCIVDADNYAKIEAIFDDCPTLEHILVVGEVDAAAPLEFYAATRDLSDQWVNVATRAEEPAWINYTSGTTGLPKGVVMPHRAVLGNVSIFEYLFDYYPQPGDVLWSQADWAWVAGFADIFLVGTFHGCRIVSTSMKGFDPVEAFRILSEHKVTVSLLTPTMLKLMREASARVETDQVQLRVVLSGGEAVGAELAHWADEHFNLTINEGFGQSECNGMIGSNPKLMPVRHGSLGKPTPGAVCAIVDEQGNEVPDGERGEIAIQRPHPAMFLHYLDDPAATANKFRGDWMVTGDIGSRDAEGYFWFHGRSDDVITSSGYRIGPTEIEDVLLSSPEVKIVAVVGVPDERRTELIKAVVVLAEGVQPSEELTASLQDLVRKKLAKHEVPHIIEYADSLPMTPTGKILRRELRGT